MSHTITAYTPRYLDSAARLYQQVYAVQPYENHGAFETSRDIIADQTERTDFIGVVAVDADDEVIGFAWGYGTPTHNPTIVKTVTKHMGAEWVDNTFMVEVIGMHFEHMSKDLAADLQNGLEQHVRQNAYDRMRVRLNIPRLDALTESLYENGWQKLKGLAHVVWLGKQLS
ncbi:MAG: hypothetical protein ACLFTK_16710 [Anaerolineales bacterium]